ncbi:EthD family reductase [Klenkia sp. LSe6-5]|uniref:EthD family reductase n=1 Tax=Klenkia sesuvii TaxID=3103137 RepID=A0ABU8DUU3_9ACTN
MTHRLLVTYGQPTDPAAFDAHYRDVHTGLAQAIPGLVRFSTGHADTMDGSPSPAYLVAELDFESAEAMAAGMSSEAGRAAGTDVGTFATGGATMVHFDVHEIDV